VDDSNQGAPKPYQDYTLAYSDPRTLNGAGDPASAAGQSENVNATIRVYDANNVLTNLFQPWGCRLGANDGSKAECQVGQIADTPVPPGFHDRCAGSRDRGAGVL